MVDGSDDPSKSAPSRRLPVNRVVDTGQSAQAQSNASVAALDDPTEMKTVRAPPAEAQQVAFLKTEPQAVAPSARPAPARVSGDGLLGALIGNYQIVRKLGEGGMGVVFEAKHQKIGTRAAIKILKPMYAQDVDFASRFLNEARAVNIIQHPSLVDIFEYGKLPDGTLYIVMEFLQGESLRSRMKKKQQAFAEYEVLTLGLQMARGLAAAHEKGIIHRDFKPENVMLVPDPVTEGQDWVKILDFGIAKVNQTNRQTTNSMVADPTKPGISMGTPLYMAPEQWGGAAEADGSTDVFSLGVILYEMLVGAPPYGSQSLDLLERPLVPPAQRNTQVSPVLSDFVARMLSTVSRQRPGTAEVAKFLASLQPSRTAQPGRAAGRRRLLWVAVAVAAVALAGAILLLLRPESLTTGTARARALDVLAAALKSEDPTLQGMALRELAQNGDLGQRSLVEPLLTSQNPLVAAEAARALGQIGAMESLPALLDMLQKRPAFAVRVSVADALARFKHPQGLKLLTELLEQGDTESKYKAALRLLDHGSLAGATLLWERVSGSKLPEMTSLAAVSELTLAGVPQARFLLEESLHKSSNRQSQLLSAFTLARLGDQQARQFLLDAAATSGWEPREQLLAARFAAQLGEQVGYDLFVKFVAADKEPDVIRELAIAGLADSGRKEALGLLGLILSQKNAALRLSAAGGILHLVADDKAHLLEQELSWAQAALGSDSALTREMAAATLGEIESDATVPPLSKALRDQQRNVRRTAARALGRKSVRAALDALTSSLDDQDTEVRAVSMRAIRRVADAMRSKGDHQSDKLAKARLQRLAREGSAPDRVMASGILGQMGDASQQASLNSALSSDDPLLRKLALEFTDAENTPLERMLKDSDLGVRFAAARRLAEHGSRAGVTVLREVMQRGDLDGLLAYIKLKGLGEAAPPPDGLSQVLQSAELSTRLDSLDAVSELSPERALPLLYIASRDSAVPVRRRTVDIAADLYQRTGSGACLHMVKAFLRDPDAIVRADASERLSGLKVQAVKPEAPSADTAKAEVAAATQVVSPPALVPQATHPSGKRAAGSRQWGTIRLVGEDFVSVQIDKLPPQPISGKPISVHAGKHRVSYLGGEQQFEVAPNGQSVIQIPVTFVEQLIHEGNESISMNRFDRAQSSFARARALEQRGRVKPKFGPDIEFGLARVYEARGDLTASLHEYNKLGARSDLRKRPELRTAVQQAMARLAPRIEHIILQSIDVAGACIRTDVYLPPGSHVVDVGHGKYQTVRARAGGTMTLNTCH